MLKALMPVATFFMGVMCGTDKPRCDVFLNMVLVSVGVVVSSYGEIHFNIVGTVYQVTGILAEALRLVLTQVLLQKKGLTLNPITSLYYIAPCRYTSLYITSTVRCMCSFTDTIQFLDLFLQCSLCFSSELVHILSNWKNWSCHH
ncbi:hypothetical protein Gotur_003006 [Gossypium turneri]